jgi:hypothetical protein
MVAEASLPSSIQSLSIWVPVLSALAGALVGSLGGVVTQLVQRASERRRERMRLAVQLAIADHDSNMKRAEASAQLGKQIRILPVALYVDFHARFLDLIDKGTVSADDVCKTYEDNRAIKAAIEKIAPYSIPKPSADEQDTLP